MPDYDLFSLTGLSFDEVKNERYARVKDAIDKVEKDLNGILGTAPDAEKASIREKLAFLADIRSQVLGPNSRLTARYAQLADEKKTAVIDQLKVYAALLKASGQASITSGAIRLQAQGVKLNRKAVTQVFTDAGLEVVDINPTAAYPVFPVNSEKTYDDLAMLRKMRDPNPNGPDLTPVADLYALAAYLEGEPANAALYRSMPLAQLQGLFDRHARMYSQRNDDLAKVLATLISSAKTNVFNSPQNQAAYEQFLLYKDEKLTSLFATMRMAPKASLESAQLAEACIKKIMEVFPDYETALAIYNKEAGVAYEPAKFFVTCAHCQNIIEFASAKEAQAKNACALCGKALYRPCRKCGAPVLASLNRCPGCGYSFDSSQLFERNYQKAKEALRKADFDSARALMAEAAIADPTEKKRLDELETQIKSEESKYERPIGELRALIAQKRLSAAADKLTEIKSLYPKLNVTAYEQPVLAGLKSAQSLITAAAARPAAERANACMDALDICVDFGPALERLTMTPPEPCAELSVYSNGKDGIVGLSWRRSLERGATYSVVRKENDVPQGLRDGTVLCAGISETSYSDTSAIPGQMYGYSVFVTRAGACSVGQGKRITLLSDVRNAHYQLSDTSLRITWDAPKNSSGATVARTAGGKETILDRNARGSFEDKGLSYGVTYSYTVRANYAGASSSGVSFSVTPTERIAPFRIGAESLGENRYRITWNLAKPGLDIRVAIDGKPVAAAKSQHKSCEITVPSGGLYVVTAAATSGGEWTDSENSVPVNTYAACRIDQKRTMFSGNRLVVRLEEPLPRDVAAFFYTVRVKSSPNQPAPWAAPPEVAKNATGDIRKITLREYETAGEITFTETGGAHEAYYISVFTLYEQGGKSALSPVARLKKSRPVDVTIRYAIKRPFIGKPSLHVTLASDTLPIYRVPRMRLCVSNDNSFLLSHEDAQAVTVLDVPEEHLSEPAFNAERSYAIDNAIPSKRGLYLFDLGPPGNEAYKILKATGFSGAL